MEKKKVVLALVLASVMVIYPLLAATFVDDTQGEFDQGTYSETQWDGTNSWVELTAAGQTNGSGNYFSGIKDAIGTATWNSIAWVESISYKEELPNNGGSGPGANMGNNMLLYHLNESSGTIYDSSGNGNNGTTYNGPTYSDTGRYNTALSFSDTNDSYIDTNSTIAVSNATGWTAEAWIYFTGESSGGETNIILQQLDGTGNGRTWLLRRRDTDRLRSFIGNSTLESTTTIDVNRWYHVAVTIGAGTNATKIIYVNGIAENSITETLENNTGIFRIARHKDTFTTHREWNGSIDEVAIYNRVLSSTEILDRYKRGVLNLRLHVTSCDDALCNGESWSSWYTVGSPANALSEANNRWFVYEAYFETEDTAYTPELQSVTIDYTPESQGPLTSGVLVAPTPTECALTVTLTAIVDDSATGNSDIAGAEYFIDPGMAIPYGTGTPMVAQDGTFDSPTENVMATINTIGLLSGDHEIVVHGRDVLGNWGATQRTTLSVTCMKARSTSAKTALTSMLPAARNNIVMGLNLLAQANDILAQAKDRNLDTAACEKLVEEAKADLAQAQARLASPTTANYFAMRAIAKLKQALECLKALVG